MSAKITRAVLESHLNCRYKSFLKLANEQGIRSDYECLLFERKEAARRQAIEKIMARHPGKAVASNIPITTAHLKKGPDFILDADLDIHQQILDHRALALGDPNPSTSIRKPPSASPVDMDQSKTRLPSMQLQTSAAERDRQVGSAALFVSLRDGPPLRAACG